MAGLAERPRLEAPWAVLAAQAEGLKRDADWERDQAEADRHQAAEARQAGDHQRARELEQEADKSDGCARKLEDTVRDTHRWLSKRPRSSRIPDARGVARRVERRRGHVEGRSRPGRRRSVSRSTSRGGDSGDDGSGSDEPGPRGSGRVFLDSREAIDRFFAERSRALKALMAEERQP